MSFRMRVMLRADASPAIGGGHIIRCLALADALRARGHDVVFAVAPGTLDVVTALSRSGFWVLDVSGEGDELIRSVDQNRIDLMVFDHYGIGADFEKLARSVSRVAVIDDAPTRPHDCDLLVDQTAGRRSSEYLTLLPSGTEVLCGSQFALLRPAFADLRSDAIARRDVEHVARTLICFGATDPGGWTVPVTRAIRTKLPDMALDIVLGASASNRSEISTFTDASHNMRLHTDPIDMAGLLVAADLGVGATGSMTWERCCLALPSVAAALVDNQRDIARILGIAGAARIVAVNENFADCVGQAVAELAGARATRQAMSAASAAVCDGLGASRVASAMERLVGSGGQRDSTGSRTRLAGRQDSELIWAWRNDWETRRASKTTAPIPFASHSLWYERVLSDRNRLLLIGESATGDPIGNVRFDRDPTGDALVSIVVAPAARGRGSGRVLLQAACSQVSEIWPGTSLVADVAEDNPASRRIFEANGFRPCEREGRFMRMRRAPSS